MQTGIEQESLNQRLRDAIAADNFAACTQALLDGANPAAMTKMTLDGLDHHCSLLTLALKTHKSLALTRRLIIFSDPKTVPKNCLEQVNEQLNTISLKLCNIIFLALQECQQAMPKFFFKNAAAANYRRGHQLFITLLQADEDINQVLKDYFSDAALTLEDNSFESRLLIKLAADPKLAVHYQLNPALKLNKKSDRIQAVQNLVHHLRERIPVAVMHSNDEELDSSDSAIPFSY